MFMVFSRAPLPDAADWPGRRWFAALDALAWPLFWVLVVAKAPMATGLLGPLVVAVALWSAWVRCHRAIWINHRYRFTTWRWGRVAVALIVLGAVLKLAPAL